ncbi:MAG: hypothetical protein E6342_17665 [Clostridium sp.]|uniref:hypothetical protein n=1 Tax=Clostridium sp. TaxID=1506 RepID=UPI002914693B|nr:hypothetical protein [Clostridium sp.]MDU4843977.1 hypothetical protein [Leclercia adecarboxylata]MDU7089517.1 hypothetical protein [Clostridium sp.]
MQRISIYLSDKDIEYIDLYKTKNNLSSRNKSLSSIIEEHKVGADITIKNMYEFMAIKIADELKNDIKNIENKISKEVISDLKPQLNSLKFSSNSTNKDTQIALELINGIYYKEEYGGIPGIEINPSKAYEMAKERVETKIAKEHYRKSNTID